MSGDVLVLDRPADGVLLLTLNRPQARNALDLALGGALHDALLAADADRDVRCIVLTGSGPAFCAGVDLKAAGTGGAAFFDAFVQKDCINLVAAVATPVIGAVNGAAFTGGLELALGCDFLLASEHAQFGDTHVRVGVLPGGGLTVRLPQAIGLRRAKEMSLTGRVVRADEAERIGLVNRVLPHGELVGAALAAARSISELGRDDVLALKGMYDGAAARVGPEALAFERRTAASRAVDGAQIDARRTAVVERNRSQLQREGSPVTPDQR